MKTYRIYTECLNEDRELIEAVSGWFDAFTIFHGTGYWQGKPKASTVVEIVSDKPELVKNVAGGIRRRLKQRAVLVVEIGTESYLVTD
jgi:hypothetical protein